MSGQPIDIRPDHEDMVRDILIARLPEGVRVWAFGSRAKWLAKPYSDLDLALEAAEPLPDALVADLKDDFMESDLPWKVDVLDINAIPPSFRTLIDEDRVVFPLMGNWRKCTLGGLVDFNPRTPLAKGEGAPFVNMAALPTGDKFFPIADVREFKGSGSKFQDDDTLLARITPCLENGKGGLVQGLGESVSAHGSTGFIVLRAKTPSDKDFAYYITKHPDFRAFAIKQMSGTSGRQRVSWQSLTDYELHDLLPEKRAAIGNLLSALDDKIELNRRMNETLEAMARAIFKDWFVDFGPTRGKMEGREPYLASEIWELFPDKLDDEGKPEGWEEKPLDEIAEFLNGLALQKFPASDRDDYLPVIKIAELRNGINAKTNKASHEVPKKYIVNDGDFIFSWFGSLMAKFWTCGEGALNQHLFKVTSKDYPAWLYSQWVFHHLAEFQGIAKSKATTMGHIQRGHLKAAKTICPPADVLERLGAVIGLFVTKAIKNDLESRTLTQIRDLLLPKLMSGEIRVREAVQLAGDVG